MGKELTDEQKAAKAKGDQSQNVEIQLLKQQIDQLFKFKILLLGAGESGKSTILKQLKYIHHFKWEEKDKEQVAQSLHQNVVECMRALITQAREFKEHNFTQEEEGIVEEIETWKDQDPLNPEIGVRISTLWKGEAIQHAYSRRNEFWLLDSFSYYMKHLERFCKPEFFTEITEEDVVMARTRTTGIVRTNLKQKLTRESKLEPDYLDFEVVDVGGQRNERKKWMHCFDDVKAVLFIVNLAGWNQVLFEDNAKNRLEESLELFQQVSNDKIFKDTPIFLFLNKKDIFETQILAQDLKTKYSDYEGGKELHAAMTYISEKFQDKLPSTKDVYIEFVSARLRADIRQAFNQVKKILYEDNRETLLKKAEKRTKELRELEAKAAGRGGGCFTIL